MKTATPLAGLFATLCLLFMLGTNTAKAQCGTVDNTSNCSVKIHLVLYDGNCMPCSPPINTVVPGNSTYSIPCTPTCGDCNIKLTVVAIGSTAITPQSMDISTTAPVSLPSVTGCSTSGMVYVSSGITFKFF